jgi:hypothetical protein
VTEKATQSVFEASLLSHAEVCKGLEKISSAGKISSAEVIFRHSKLRLAAPR